MPTPPTQHLVCSFELRQIMQSMATQIRTGVQARHNGDDPVSSLTDFDFLTAITGAWNQWLLAGMPTPGVPTVHTAEWSRLMSEPQ